MRTSELAPFDSVVTIANKRYDKAQGVWLYELKDSEGIIYKNLVPEMDLVPEINLKNEMKTKVPVVPIEKRTGTGYVEKSSRFNDTSDIQPSQDTVSAIRQITDDTVLEAEASGDDRLRHAIYNLTWLEKWERKWERTSY